DKIHLDWIKKYEAENGYKEAKKYYEDIESGENFFRNNKFDDRIHEATIFKIATINKNDITKKWDNANSKKEEEQIEEESFELLDNIAFNFLNELEKFINDTNYFEEFYNMKKEEEKIIADKERANCIAMIMGIIISIFSITVYWKLLFIEYGFIGGIGDFILIIVLVIIY